MPDTIREAIIPLFAPRAWGGALGVLGLAGLLGLAVLARARRMALCDRLLLSFIAGLPLVALLVLGAGQIHGLLFRAPWGWLGAVGWGVVVISIGKLVIKNNRLRLRARARARPFADEVRTREEHSDAGGKTGPIGVLGWALVGLTLLFLLAPAVAPPINYDVLEYHLGFVPHVFATGLVRPIPHVFYTAQPIATELLYTLAAAIEGAAWGFAPGLLQWLLLLLGVLVITRLFVHLGLDPAWRPWLLLILLFHPIILNLQLDRLTDWTGALFFAGGLLALLANSYDEHRANRRSFNYSAILLGICAGGAIGAKWTHAGTVAAPLFLLVFAAGASFLKLGNAESAERPIPLSRRLIRGLVGLLVAGGAALAVVLPWCAWLWVVRGNPVAPFLARVFPTPAWPPARLEFLMQTHGALHCWQAAYWINLVGRLVGGLPGWRVPGLPLIPLALVGAGAILALHAADRRTSGTKKEESQTTVRLSATLGLGILISVLLWGQLRNAADRFLAPVLLNSLLTLGLAFKWGAGWLERRAATESPDRSVPRLIVAGLLAATALFNLYGRWGMLFDSGYGQLLARHALGQVDRTQWGRQTLGLTAELFEAANHLPADSKIVAINEARRYPFARAIDLASVFDESPVRPAVTGAPDGETIRQRLLTAGYSHLLVNDFEQGRILGMHTPPVLHHDPAFQAALRRGDPTELATQYWGYTEFAVDPLTPAERAAYGQFLTMLRSRALWVRAMNDAPAPAMWIAALK